MPSGDVLRLVLGSGLIAGAAAMICFYAALSLDEVSRIKPIAFTIAPATAVVLGWLLLGETMTWRKALAVVLVLAGIVLPDRRPARPRGRGGDAEFGAALALARIVGERNGCVCLAFDG